MGGDKRPDEFVNGGKIGDTDRPDRGVRDVCEDVGSTSDEVVTSSSGSAINSREDVESSRSRNNRVGLADRLAEILVDQGDGDLLLQQNERETNFLQWLQALDLQVMGACRADERLKPMLKANASSGAAEGRLLAHLSQHFDTTEVGLLARCLCIPLVSIRAGKIIKQGTVLCPSPSRGNLNVALLPSSDLRISFIGDDGQAERIATLGSSFQCSTVAIEEIPADNSGRSFLIRSSNAEVFYFWCAEKSRLLGIELLSKMKDVLKRKPTLASLTGISELRLERFASHLRAYLVGSNILNQRSSTIGTSSSTLLDTISHEIGQCSQFSTTSPKPSRPRHSNGAHQPLKSHTQYQGSLSPRSNSFKEGCPRSSRIASREKIKRRGDCNIHLSSINDSASSLVPSTASLIIDPASLDHLSEENYKHSEITSSNSTSTLSFLESLGNASLPPLLTTASQRPPVGAGSLFSPYYCWCPPCPSQTTPLSAQLPLPASIEPFSSLFPGSRAPGALLAEIPPLNLGAQIPTLNFSSPSLSVQGSSQIPTFTPLMCDPIVHVPVIDICSSGPGYLVSAGPTALTSSIPSLMIQESPEAVMEKGARETLRLLIGGSSAGQQATLMGVLPSNVLNEDNKGKGMLVVGSRGMYSGTSDVDAIASSFAVVGLASLLSEGSASGGGLDNHCREKIDDSGKEEFGFEGAFSSGGKEKDVI